MTNYGKELILDLHDCNIENFTREGITAYMKELCKRIDMHRAKLVFWDDLHTKPEYKQTLPHLVGTSAVQFIHTSNVTIHTLDLMKRVYLNIFSCKDFDSSIAEAYSAEYFSGTVKQSLTIDRI